MVPESLKRWFVVHCIADVVFALPLFVAPVWFLTLLGWTHVDPIATRLVAAALFGIGIQSYLGRNESRDAFVGMLNLKVIWSLSATVGLVWSQLQGGPPLAWGFVAIFGSFHGLWLYYRVRLHRA